MRRIREQLAASATGDDPDAAANASSDEDDDEDEDVSQHLKELLADPASPPSLDALLGEPVSQVLWEAGIKNPALRAVYVRSFCFPACAFQVMRE